GRPEPGRVRGQGLVAKDELVAIEAELEFRVGDDDPAPQGIVRRESVQGERQALDLGEPLRADAARRLLARDVLVVAGLRLGSRREDGLGQAAGRREPGRNRGPGYLVLCPVGL